VLFLQENKDRTLRTTVLLVCGILLLAAGLVWLWYELPHADATGANHVQLVAPGAKQAQSIQYTRCGHEVLRRVDVPPEWVGLSKDAVLHVMDPAWRMTAFSPAVLEMSRAMDMFCPQHFVLLLGPDGAPGVYRNRYGFSMERLEDVTLRALDEATWETLAQGLAFDSREALNDWVRDWSARQSDTRT